MKRRALFVDDEPRILQGLRRMLHSVRGEWDCGFARGGEEATEMLAARDHDVVVSDMRMPGMDGAALLAHCREHHPGTIRVVLSGHMELENALRSVNLAHQFLTKPCEAETLRCVLRRTAALTDLGISPELRALLGTIDRVPLRPRTREALVRALDDPRVPARELAAIVEPNPLLSAKILQLVNSAFFSTTPQVSNLAEAMQAIGRKVLRRLLPYLEVVDSLEEVIAAETFSLQRHRLHAARVGLAAKALSTDGVRAEEAFTAGMLHDVGELLLAVHGPTDFDRCSRRARSEGRARFEVERDELGFDHPAVGAYLLGLWGLPPAVVEAVALHHEPSRVDRGRAGLATVVHVADTLVEENTAGSGHRDARPETAHLDAVLPPGRLDVCREIVSEIVSRDLEFAHV